MRGPRHSMPEGRRPVVVSEQSRDGSCGHRWLGRLSVALCLFGPLQWSERRPMGDVQLSAIAFSVANPIVLEWLGPTVTGFIKKKQYRRYMFLRVMLAYDLGQEANRAESCSFPRTALESPFTSVGGGGGGRWTFQDKSTQSKHPDLSVFDENS